MTRTIVEIIQGRPTQDGAGVNLLRVLGGQRLDRFDPFLMLDEFGSTNPDDYIAGFPPHPHRGFTTITYMLEGHFEHRDHMGHVGAIGQGGVQWMNAGRGIIHSEMPIQKSGTLRGFQLWLNLPAKSKMSPPSYENIEADGIAQFVIDQLSIKAIVGTGLLNHREITAFKEIADTSPLFWDIHHQGTSSQSVVIAIPDGHTALLYIADGEAYFSEGPKTVHSQHLLRFSSEGALMFELAAASRVLLLSGKPIGEPIVQHGPFVMNSVAEIEQAIQDYQNGTLTAPNG